MDRNLLDAELAVATKFDEKVAAFKKYLDWMNTKEKFVKAWVAVGAESPLDLYRTRAKRLGAEIDLLRLKLPPGENDTAEIKVLLKEKRDALREVWKTSKAISEAGGRIFDSPQWSWELLELELALSRNPADRIAACEKHVEDLTRCQRSVKMVGVPIESEVLDVSIQRLTAEIILLREKEKTVAP